MDWDSENFDVPTVIPTGVVNKWDGEDEDDNIKESWDDDEEEKKKEEAQKKAAAVNAAQPKKVKTKLQEKIEEREKKDLEKKSNLKNNIVEEEEDTEDLTAEEKQAEKLRRQKLQEEADLEVAKEVFGINEEPQSVSKMNPRTKEDFKTFQELLCKKIINYKNSEHFSYFTEELIRNICVHLQMADLKKLKLLIDNLFNEKSKLEKSKQKAKSKNRAKLRVDGNDCQRMQQEYAVYKIKDGIDFPK